MPTYVSGPSELPARVDAIGCLDGTTSADFRFLHMGLPPQIVRLKSAGELKRAIELCDQMLARGIAPQLAGCLRAERYRMRELPREYCIPFDRAIEMVQAEWPTFGKEDWDRLIDSGRIDWRLIEGVPCVLETFLDSLRIYPSEVPGLAPEPPRDTATRDAMLGRMRRQGSCRYVVTIKAGIDVLGARRGDAVRAWLPVPRACALQSDIEIIDATPGCAIAPQDAPARTAFWESSAASHFEITYRYQTHASYLDWAGGARGAALPKDPAPVSADLAEYAPHIIFTPYLRALADRLVGNVEDPLARAKAIYDYVTGNVDYRYQPAYFELDSIADECAHALRGDCGVMALLFIALCRIAGIPARWQSGLSVAPDHVGPHDWAQFYIEDRGWLYADCSFGSSARRLGEVARREHYFGNLDPWRMVANGRFQAELTPSDRSIRHDPYDNQVGEATVNGRGCRDYEMRRTVELIDMVEVQ